MKPLNFLVRVGVVAVLAIGLTACGKKKNGSSGGGSTASTPGSTCQWDQSRNAYINPSNGQVCNNTNTQVCPANGQYTNQNGQVVTCTPGQAINNFPNPGGYPWNGFGLNGCSQYYYQYGVPYVPVYFQQYGQYMCVRYDLLSSQYSNPNYGYYGYNYYYSYPPYTGNNCNNQINFGGNWGYVGLCF